MPTKKPAADELMTLTEVAKLYGLSTIYLRNIAASGRLNARKVGHYWVTTQADVDRYLATRQKKGAYRDDIGT